MPNPVIITSRQHPVSKLIRALNSPRQRRLHGLFVATGANVVTAALRAHWPLERLVVTPDDAANGWEETARQAGVPLTLAHAELLAYLGDLSSVPEVLALARLPAAHHSQLLSDGLTLVLDGIGDPGNIGTLIRSADAAGAGGILASDNSSDPFSCKAVRASAGSVFHMPLLDWEDHSPAALAARLQRENLPVVIAAAHNGQSCFDFAWPARCALVLGHETRGVASEWEAIASARVTIPMHGRVESLNVAAAGAVLLYAWRMQN
jgi:TrmH family RNA methyltransferase